MINQFDAVKSCLDTLKGYADQSNYRIAIDGIKFVPIVGETYLQESFLANDNDQGLNNSVVQVQLPIYQVNIHVPKEYGNWRALQVYTQLVGVFERGTDISNNPAQQVRIEQVNNRILPPTDTHNVLACSIDLRVIG